MIENRARENLRKLEVYARAGDGGRDRLGIFARDLHLKSTRAREMEEEPLKT